MPNRKPKDPDVVIVPPTPPPPTKPEEKYVPLVLPPFKPISQSGWEGREERDLAETKIEKLIKNMSWSNKTKLLSGMLEKLSRMHSHERK